MVRNFEFVCSVGDDYASVFTLPVFATSIEEAQIKLEIAMEGLTAHECKISHITLKNNESKDLLVSV